MGHILQSFKNEYKMNENKDLFFSESTQLRATDLVGHSPKRGSKGGVYSPEDVERAVAVFRLLINVRERCRKQGLINW